MGKDSAIPTEPHHHNPLLFKRAGMVESKIPKTINISTPKETKIKKGQKERTLSLEKAATTATVLDAEQDRVNIDKTQSKTTPNEPSSLGTRSGGGPRCQETIGDTIAQARSENVSKLSNDPLLTRENKDCSSLGDYKFKTESQEVREERRITRTKAKRLYKVGRSARIVSSDEASLGDQEDASKQGRKIDDIDKDAEITLVDETQGDDGDYIKKEGKHLQSKRPEEKRNKPPQNAQQRSIMCTILKTIEGWKPKDLKSKDSIREQFKRVGDELEQESIKKQKVDEDKETAKLKSQMEVIIDEEKVAVDAIPLATKPPSIVDWKIHKEGKKSYYQIIRADGSSKMYLSIQSYA
ncbi:hypothetical protein Tco_0653150 [Tanacetum coccineum]|uniref:Uncharacterized protein n=1 Tax=Tanacetum coccineum TaxID=301880 RepID=A0ABQ4X0C4_9ASTR